jgi:hypothetical protein
MERTTTQSSAKGYQDSIGYETIEENQRQNISSIWSNGKVNQQRILLG